MDARERRRLTADTYRVIATELDHHFNNDSDWLYRERDGSDSPEEVVKLRTEILRAAVKLFTHRALRLEKRGR